jgi:UDP-GlcNAc:undecaprenyl-phosphate/decaprenyl-phosphate GlcNAc-1-phosphate transferase
MNEIVSTYLFALIISFSVAIISTPFISLFAKKIGALDKPNSRKVHKEALPRLGGLSIIFGTFSGYLYLTPYSAYMPYIFIGALIIITVGIVDDTYSLAPIYKLTGQTLAALLVVTAGLKIEFITLPLYGEVHFGVFSYLFTIFWIVSITNTINLIDGLDGLAAGVSIIALTSILIMAILNNQMFIVALSIIIIGSTLGFLIFNFYPAKIFMGDTGSMFLGYSISIISMMGLLKSVALLSFVIPIIILAVPIFDTFFAIIRRILNKQKISAPDKSHLHHRFLAMGFGHRSSVLIIYLYSTFFGIAAILFSTATLWVCYTIIVISLLLIQFTAEFVGLIGERKPLISVVRKIILDVTQGVKSN